MSANFSPISFSVASTDEDFEQVLHLQQENLLHNLNGQLLAEQGFVFAEHTLPILKIMAAKLPQVVALSNSRIVGYNLAMDVSMKNELPSLTPMFEEFEKCSFKNKKLSNIQFIIGGQVCVDKNYRGHGLMSKLYHETAYRLKNEYQLCVTEISIRNPKSLVAHQKMGFEIIADYYDGNEHWHIVAWEW